MNRVLNWIDKVLLLRGDNASHNCGVCCLYALSLSEWSNLLDDGISQELTIIHLSTYLQICASAVRESLANVSKTLTADSSC